MNAPPPPPPNEQFHIPRDLIRVGRRRMAPKRVLPNTIIINSNRQQFKDDIPNTDR